MGKIIFSNDFLDLGTITSRTEDASYPDDNIEDYWHLGRRFRADDLITNNWLLRCDFGAATVVEAVVLNFVNFEDVIIQGDDTGTFATPDYTSATISISLDERVNRHKIYIPLTGFNWRHLEVFIPNGTAATGDFYQTKWQVGSVVALHSVTEFTRNMSWGYTRKSQRAFRELLFLHGGFEVVNLGEYSQWVGKASFGSREMGDEDDLWELNRITSGSPMIFYENDGDDSKTYLCAKTTDYEGTLIFNDVITGSSMEFRELI
jgi:hypothetical protein